MYKSPKGSFKGSNCGGWGSRCIKELNRPAWAAPPITKLFRNQEEIVRYIICASGAYKAQRIRLPIIKNTSCAHRDRDILYISAQTLKEKVIEIKIVCLLTQLFGISIYHEDQNAYKVWSNHIEEYGAGEWVQKFFFSI